MHVLTLLCRTRQCARLDSHYLDGTWFTCEAPAMRPDAPLHRVQFILSSPQ
ncbi:hypothetical protein HMPREF0620_0907 [Parascardovia denticolens DSM 10105 = JCM 12538]|uniref:Uncharacterized protein n=1 Tax=Parascardovia denticolens DSM 10105 = JCM 12538 TaxID=864564 RepID=E6JYW7_PARDN|nr:hypothetical protein HMPREF0620_0907 [Parascardovia denticolens DSM 10105 = JCM 12538]